MHCARIFWIGFAAGLLLMCQDGLATNHAPRNARLVHGIGGISKTAKNDRRPIANHAPGDRERQTDSRRTADDYRSGYAAGMSDGKHAAAQLQRDRRDAVIAEKSSIRERAERDARAERIYRSSQLSAPIILDARACRRIDLHGESIYENCQLAGH
jgi:hypothetical protein